MTAVRVRQNIVEMPRSAGRGHIGGLPSAVDILTALHFCEMRVRPDEPEWTDRIRFIAPGPFALAEALSLASSETRNRLKSSALHLESRTP